MIMVENDKMTTAASAFDKNMRRSYLALLLVFYLAGSFLGIFLTEKTSILLYDEMGSTQPAVMLVRFTIPVFLLLLYATSSVGWILIPVLFASVGFTVSAYTVCLIKSGVGYINSFLVSGIPALLILTVLFSLGETAMRKTAFIRIIAKSLPDGAEPCAGGYAFFGAAVLSVLSSASACYLAAKLLN